MDIELPTDQFYRHYLGWSALGTYYLMNISQRGIDSHGPENPLILSLGPLTGAPISGQSRLTATAKSPLTDAVGDSQSGMTT